MANRGGRISSQCIFVAHFVGGRDEIGDSGWGRRPRGDGARGSIGTITTGLLAGVRHSVSRDKEAGAGAGAGAGVGAGKGIPSVCDKVVRVGCRGTRHHAGDFITEVSSQVCVGRATRN